MKIHGAKEWSTYEMAKAIEAVMDYTAVPTHLRLMVIEEVADAVGTDYYSLRRVVDEMEVGPLFVSQMAEHLRHLRYEVVA